MAYHGVLIPEATAALNIDSLNRSFMCSASTLDNGMIFQSTIKNWVSGSGAEVFNIAAPATGSLINLWMVYSGDEIPLTEGKWKGLSPDPRDFYISQGQVFSGFKPQVGDIILVTAESLTGTAGLGFANAVNGAYQLTWSATSAGTGYLSFKLLATKYISLATGSIGNQRVTAYEFECISV